MQNTRLNGVPSFVAGLVEEWLQNPWRRIVTHTIGFLGGFFLGIVVSTYTGQRGTWDLTAGGLTVLGIEAVSWYFYRPGNRTTAGSVLHTIKLGMTYNIILEAFKLGS